MVEVQKVRSGMRAERWRRVRRSLGLAASLLAIGTATPALAQDDVQGRSVAERNAPEFTSEPIRVGGFELFPSIEANVEYVDNVFASANNPVDDFILAIRPQLLVRDRRPDREIRAVLSAGLRQYVDTETENSEQLRLDALARWGLGTRTRYRTGVEIVRNAEQRRNFDSFTTIVEPIAFTSLRSNVGVTREFGPVTGSIDLAARSTQYDGTTVIDGREFDFGFRDFNVYSAVSRASFSRSRDQEVYVQLTLDERNYQARPSVGNDLPFFAFDRSSRGGRLELGYRRQLTELLYIDARAGYLVQDFEQTGLGSVTGLAFETDLLWNVTPLTSIEFTAARRVDDRINPLLSGLVRTEAAARVEHELLRNLILVGRGRYSNLDQLDAGPDADEYEIGASAEYRLDRNWTVMLRAEHFERSGLFEFEQNEIGLGLRYNF